MPSLPTILLLGAPSTGAQALGNDLQAHLAPGTAHILYSPAAGERAAAQAASASLVLLMGLDLPCPASDRAAQEAVDARLRADLARAGGSYRVVYGRGDQRLANALIAINTIALTALPSRARSTFDSYSSANARTTARLRAWNCEKCSDPECEHRLFTALTSRDAVRST